MNISCLYMLVVHELIGDFYFSYIILMSYRSNRTFKRDYASKDARDNKHPYNYSNNRSFTYTPNDSDSSDDDETVNNNYNNNYNRGRGGRGNGRYSYNRDNRNYRGGRGRGNGRCSYNSNYNRDNNRVDNRTDNRAETASTQQQPQQQPQQQSYQTQQINYIELIPVHFNSLQVRMLCDQLWANGAIDTLEGLLHFFETLRKAIIQMRVKDNNERLDPKYPEMIQSFNPPVIPSDSFSFFSEEIAPRADNSTNYDEETWAKMFISMLPRPDIQINIDLRTFKLIAEISQQITQSEIAVIRYKIEKDNNGPMNRELDALYDEQDRYGWSEEKLAAEQKKVRSRWNIKAYEARKARQNEVWAMYDKMYEYFNDENVNNFNDKYILSTWRFVTRNPLFPFQQITIGNETFPASRFSLVEAFNQPPTAFSQAFTTIRKWYYSKHPNVDPIKPTPEEFNDWYNHCCLYNISELLSDFACEKPTILTLSTLDNKVFEFYQNWINTQYGQAPQSEPSRTQNALDEFINDNNSSKPSARFVRMACVYPYYKIRLFEEKYSIEVGQMLNRLVERNYQAVSAIIKSFNHDVIIENLVNRLILGQGNAEINIRLANEIGVNKTLITRSFEENLAKLNKPIDDVIYVSSCLIVGRLYDEPLIETFNRMLTMFKSDESQAIFLKGFVNRIPTHTAECLELKEAIISVAQAIFGRTRFGVAHFHSADVIEAFNKI